MTLSNGRNPFGTCVNGSHVKHYGTLCRMGVTRVELRFTPETAVRIGTTLSQGYEERLRANIEHVDNNWDMFSGDKVPFVYAMGIWTYRPNSDRLQTFDVAQFVNVANFNSFAYESIVNTVGDYYGYAKIWQSIIDDILPVYETHMSGESTGALFINLNEAHNLIASYRMKVRINYNSQDFHASPRTRNTLLERVEKYGVQLINDNDAMEAELEEIKSAMQVIKAVSWD